MKWISINDCLPPVHEQKLGEAIVNQSDIVLVASYLGDDEFVDHDYYYVLCRYCEDGTWTSISEYLETRITHWAKIDDPIRTE